MKQNTWLIFLYRQLAPHQIKLKFIIVGAVGFATNSTVLFIAAHFSIHKVFAEIIGMAVSLQPTFLLHDKWTYIRDRKSHTYHKPLSKRYSLYLASNSFGSVLTVVLFTVFSNFLNNIISLAVASIISMFWNFTINKIVIWKHVHQD